jgi:hypothetical protein
MGPADGVAGRRIKETPYRTLVSFAAARASPFFSRPPADAAGHLTTRHDLRTSRHQVLEQGTATMTVASNVN